jgi:uncharacterized protein YjiS (DUF1127 family)
MTTSVANSQFAFQLPNLSYVDASWEEPDLRAARPSVPRRPRLWARLSARIIALAAWRQQAKARAELDLMTDRELLDIGLSRTDLERVFVAEHNTDLMRRGTNA